MANEPSRKAITRAARLSNIRTNTAGGSMTAAVDEIGRVIDRRHALRQMAEAADAKQALENEMDRGVRFVVDDDGNPVPSAIMQEAFGNPSADTQDRYIARLHAQNYIAEAADRLKNMVDTDSTGLRSVGEFRQLSEKIRTEATRWLPDTVRDFVFDELDPYMSAREQRIREVELDDALIVADGNNRVAFLDKAKKAAAMVSANTSPQTLEAVQSLYTQASAVSLGLVASPKATTASIAHDQAQLQKMRKDIALASLSTTINRIDETDTASIDAMYDGLLSGSAQVFDAEAGKMVSLASVMPDQRDRDQYAQAFAAMQNFRQQWRSSQLKATAQYAVLDILQRYPSGFGEPLAPEALAEVAQLTAQPGLPPELRYAFERQRDAVLEENQRLVQSNLAAGRSDRALATDISRSRFELELLGSTPEGIAAQLFLIDKMGAGQWNAQMATDPVNAIEMLSSISRFMASSVGTSKENARFTQQVNAALSSGIPSTGASRTSADLSNLPWEPNNMHHQEQLSRPEVLGGPFIQPEQWQVPTDDSGNPIEGAHAVNVAWANNRDKVASFLENGHILPQEFADAANRIGGLSFETLESDQWSRLMGQADALQYLYDVAPEQFEEWAGSVIGEPRKKSVLLMLLQSGTALRDFESVKRALHPAQDPVLSDFSPTEMSELYDWAESTLSGTIRGSKPIDRLGAHNEITRNWRYPGDDLISSARRLTDITMLPWPLGNAADVDSNKAFTTMLVNMAVARAPDGDVGQVKRLVRKLSRDPSIILPITGARIQVDGYEFQAHAQGAMPVRADRNAPRFGLSRYGPNSRNGEYAVEQYPVDNYYKDELKFFEQAFQGLAYLGLEDGDAEAVSRHNANPDEPVFKLWRGIEIPDQVAKYVETFWNQRGRPPVFGRDLVIWGVDHNRFLMTSKRRLSGSEQLEWFKTNNGDNWFVPFDRLAQNFGVEALHDNPFMGHQEALRTAADREEARLALMQNWELNRDNFYDRVMATIEAKAREEELRRISTSRAFQ